MGNVGVFPKFRAFTATGAVAAGYLLYFYEAGTSTAKNVYTAYDRATPTANPLTLDSAGETSFFYGSGRYKVVLKTGAGVTVWTMDYVTGDVGYVDDSVTPNVFKFYNGTAYVSTAQIYAPSDLYGCDLSVNASDAEHDMDISAGHRCDSTSTYNMVLASGLTKRLDAAWAAGTNQGGLDTGTIAAGCYHVWLIKNPTSAVVDVLFSASATAPVMPTGYTIKRRLGALRTDGSANIYNGTYIGTSFFYATSVADSAVVPGATKTDYSLSTPTGVVATAFITVSGQAGAGGATNIWGHPKYNTSNAMFWGGTSASEFFAVQARVMTDTVTKTAFNYTTTAPTSFAVTTNGWDDFRLLFGA